MPVSLVRATLRMDFDLTVRELLDFVSVNKPVVMLQQYNGRQWITVEFVERDGGRVTSQGSVTYWPASARMQGDGVIRGDVEIHFRAYECDATFRSDRKAFEAILLNLTGKTIDETLGQLIEVAA